MKEAKNGRSAGFSLVEVLTAIAVLGLIAAPVGAGLVLSHRLNARSQELMQAQLAVSGAVETLMAEGIESGSVEESGTYQGYTENTAVSIQAVPEGAAYKVTVSSRDSDLDVTVVTYIRPAPETGGEPSG